MNKRFFIGAVLVCGLVAGAVAAPKTDNVSTRQARALHFAHGATTLNVRDNISGSQHRFYTLKMKAGQHLKIRVQSDEKTKSGLVPLIFVTPPCGKYNGDKTSTYSEDSSRAGNYRIEVAANQMASRASYGAFVLHIEAY